MRVADWPSHEIAGEAPLDVGTLVWVVPGRSKTRWRGRVAMDMPMHGLTAVLPTEPGIGWSREAVTVTRVLVKRRMPGER